MSKAEQYQSSGLCKPRDVRGYSPRNCRNSFRVHVCCRFEIQGRKRCFPHGSRPSKVREDVTYPTIASLYHAQDIDHPEPRRVSARFERARYFARRFLQCTSWVSIRPIKYSTKKGVNTRRLTKKKERKKAALREALSTNQAQHHQTIHHPCVSNHGFPIPRVWLPVLPGLCAMR